MQNKIIDKNAIHRNEITREIEGHYGLDLSKGIPDVASSNPPQKKNILNDFDISQRGESTI